MGERLRKALFGGGAAVAFLATVSCHVVASLAQPSITRTFCMLGVPIFAVATAICAEACGWLEN